MSLTAAANPDDAATMAQYMRNQFPFLGVKTPLRRQLSRPIYKVLTRDPSKGPNWQLVEKLWGLEPREFQYVACDYLQSISSWSVEDVARLKVLVSAKAWWDTVDPLSLILGEALRQGTVEKQVVRDWAIDSDFWVRRAAIICQRRLKQQTQEELLASVIAANFDTSEFFINKAIGWALRDYSKINPRWVSAFIGRCGDRLSALSVREGAKYL